jgi:mono/diheme cytochrome c family protein
MTRNTTRRASLSGAARLLGLLALATAAGTARADERAIEFNRDIRPILSEHCYACHGPDARKREAGLRLDVEDAAQAEPPSGNRAVVPGRPDDSELVFRVETDDPESMMPPPKTGKPLRSEQVALLRKWVEAGAPWEPHWSLAPIRRPAVPAVEGFGKVENPVDGFVLSALAAKGVAPSPEADRVALIRRLSFDLTGLPPTPAEVERFVGDDDPMAYERLVDRLLASPRFGERMAIFWLDLVRYADSVGYHGDQPVSVSPFRDYVIKAFNENKPFDRFTLEQLAGDLLPQPTQEQRIAAGYNRLGMMSAEGGVQPKEYLAKYAAERVRNIGGAWLGATLGCCECHDHKYDPFATRDFYRMEAFFADIRERGLYDSANFGPFMPVLSPEQEAELARLDGQIAAARKALGRSTPELEAAQAEWERRVNPPIEWTTLAPLDVRSANGATLTVLEDGSVLASGDSPEKDTYTIVARAPSRGITAIRLEAMPDPSLPKQGPGRAENGNFVVSELKLGLRRAAGADPQPIVLGNASATFEQTEAAESLPDKALKAASAIDGKVDSKLGWAVAGDTGHANSAVFETKDDLVVDPEAVLTIELVQDHQALRHTLGRFRVQATTAPRPVAAPGAGLPRAIRDVLDVSPADRDPSQKDAVAAYHRTVTPLLASERERLAALEKERSDLVAGATMMIATETVEPRPIRVLPRGNWMDDSGELVEPGVPAVLPQPEASGRRLDRADLARWLVSPENPLTPRTLANRLWKLYFGAGLSTKLDDLGAQGDWPSHPELLDYLAGRLVDTGWDVKGLIRLIVTSRTYKQSSSPRPDLKEKDPNNRWLARQGRFRLDAEMVRDAALASGGLLVEHLGGPSVFPYQPPGYWSFLNFPKREWQNDRGTAPYRRGLYVHWQRQYLYPSFLAFDAPSREECTAERVRSSTPLQALVLLNDPAYVEAARALGSRAIREGGPDLDARLDWAFRQVVSRPIRPNQRRILAALHAEHLAAYRKDPDAAKALLAVGQGPAPADLDPAELAAWTDVARVLLNLHAAITRD